MVTILMMSAKMTTLGLLKIKDYDAIVYVHDFSNNVLLRVSDYIVDVVM